MSVLSSGNLMSKNTSSGIRQYLSIVVCIAMGQFTKQILSLRLSKRMMNVAHLKPQSAEKVIMVIFFHV